MSITRLDEIDQRAQAATPGPWSWRNTGPVYLQGARTRVVMAFERMGMHGAQPALRDADGVLRKAGRDNLHAHPDTVFIAAARSDVPALVAALRAGRARLAGHVEHGAIDPIVLSEYDATVESVLGGA